MVEEASLGLGCCLGHGCKLTGPRGCDLPNLFELLCEILDRVAEALLDRHLWLPTNVLASHGDVGLALLGIVRGLGPVHNGRVGFCLLDYQLSKLFDRVLVRVAEVARLVVVRVHELEEALDKVVYVLEGARGLAVPVDGDVLALEGLDDEVGHHTPVVRVHARPEGVENPRDANVHVPLRLVSVHHGLRHPLALVVARAGPDGVHVAVVRLLLGVLLGVAVDL
mmetsp:Transcript_12336/g.31881  ORF Transcript_12336/g.31881 Transcript_12336/m.31881 type:complete len:224 (-) Transcript_12336:663-1334(-)